MSESTTGPRKKSNIKDHLILLHGKVNSVINGKEDCINIQVFYIEKAFNSLWLEDCLLEINNLLPDGWKDEKLIILYLMNKTNMD